MGFFKNGFTSYSYVKITRRPPSFFCVCVCVCERPFQMAMWGASFHLTTVAHTQACAAHFVCLSHGNCYFTCSWVPWELMLSACCLVSQHRNFAILQTQYRKISLPVIFGGKIQVSDLVFSMNLILLSHSYICERALFCFFSGKIQISEQTKVFVWRIFGGKFKSLDPRSVLKQEIWGKI